MSTLTSASTDTQVNAAYDDNASYLEDLSVAKCAAFITAARILLRRMDAEASDSGSSYKKNTSDVRADLAAATQWLAENGTARVESGRTDFTRGRCL